MYIDFMSDSCIALGHRALHFSGSKHFIASQIVPLPGKGRIVYQATARNR